jgi:deoxyribose-phosphate aldolase
MAKAIALTEALAMVERAEVVDAQRLEERAADLAGNPMESEAGLTELAIRCTDLTSLSEDDTSEKIADLCATAIRPDPADTSTPSVAAVCVHPDFVPTAVDALAGSPVKVAAVAGGFPTGAAPRAEKMDEIRRVLDLGADEVDMAMNRSAFLAGEYGATFDEVAAAKKICRDAPLKVILETGALGSYDEISKATVLVMAAGADFVKTSTGKTAPGASPPVALCIMDAIRDAQDELGGKVGVKASGGVREAETARAYVRLVHGALGPEWMHPARFRIGASSLLDDLVREVRRERSAKAQGRC